MKTITLICGLLLLSLSSFAIDLPNFREVDANIFRSGRPTEKGLRELVAEKNVKTIINLEDSSSNIQKEAAWAEKLHLVYRSFPTGSFSRPKDKKVQEILALLNDPTYYPILIHCKHGEDRTGLMVGLRRVFDEGWTPKAAYLEMLDMGFHTILWSLDGYFKDKTGYSDNQNENEYLALSPSPSY